MQTPTVAERLDALAQEIARDAPPADALALAVTYACVAHVITALTEHHRPVPPDLAEKVQDARTRVMLGLGELSGLALRAEGGR